MFFVLTKTAILNKNQKGTVAGRVSNHATTVPSSAQTLKYFDKTFLSYLIKKRKLRNEQKLGPERLTKSVMCRKNWNFHLNQCKVNFQLLNCTIIKVPICIFIQIS